MDDATDSSVSRKMGAVELFQLMLKFVLFELLLCAGPSMRSPALKKMAPLAIEDCS